MSDIMRPTLFLCWSGHRSKQVAETFKTYFESVFEAADLKPGSDSLIAMSETLIAKGAPWSGQLLQDLKNAQAGIVVLTPENRGSAWLHFEGGAIATQGFKAQNGGANTVPSHNNLFGFLFTIDSTQIEGPLSQGRTSRTEEAAKLNGDGDTDSTTGRLVLYLTSSVRIRIQDAGYARRASVCTSSTCNSVPSICGPGNR